MTINTFYSPNQISVLITNISLIHSVIAYSEFKSVVIEGGGSWFDPEQCTF